MRRLFVAMTIVALLVVPQFALSGEVDDLMAAHQKFMQAWNTLDAETIASLTSQGAVVYNPNAAFPLVGPRESTQAERAEYMKYFLQNTESMSITPYNVQYRVFGNTGIAYGHLTISSKQKGEQSHTAHIRYTSTWIKSDGKWLIVMYHDSAIPSDD